MNFCIYCHIDCDISEIHAPSCPFVTNLWPINHQDIECGLTCPRCHYTFSYEDYYIKHGIEILCISCAIEDWKENVWK